MFFGIAISPFAQGINIKRFDPIKIDGSILYVGGTGPSNYSSIQDAINDSNYGDIVFVFDDSSPYYENVIINKSINLRGENRNSTVIDGRKITDVVIISVDCVNINGFTIQNSGNLDTDAGIKIHSKNNKITGNIILNNDKGISIWNSSNNTVTGNFISNNDYGIKFFTNSFGNIISDNKIISNKFRGILLESSDSNKISDNNISNNGNGIRLEESFSNIISNNIISNNGNGIDLLTSNSTTISDNLFFNDGLQIYDSYQNTITNNIVNGKPLIYYESESNKVIDEAGQIILVNCENITIQDQELFNINYGIELWQTKNCLIEGNTLYSNDYVGIFLHSSSNNTITGNKIFDNNNGIALDYYGSNNKITNNIISNNTYGINLYYSSSNNNISNNYFSNNFYGVQLFFSYDITITSNNFSNNYFGVSLWYNNYNTTIFSNKFFSGGVGIWLNGVNDNLIFGNTFIDCVAYGIWIIKSIHNTIIENNIINCMCGINIDGSSINTIKENTFVGGGILALNSFQNTVFNNIVNGKPLVYLEDTSNINIDDAGQVILINCENISIKNKELYNLMIGIELWNTNYCNISNNTLTDNYHGSWFINSNNNTISGNDISNYIDWGIFLFSSWDNTITENKLYINNQYCKRSVSFNRINTFLYNIILRESSKNPQFFQNSTTFIDDIYSSKNINSYLVLGEPIFNKSKGITLSKCSRNIISGNNISNNQDGFIFEESISNTIIGNNIVLNKQYGIHIKDSCKNNKIIKNIISKSGVYGIFLESSNFNKIKQNNFMDNNKSVFFENSIFNRWIRNYWEIPRILPKIIFGKIKIGNIYLPWFNIDLLPAKKPNNM